MSEAAKISVRFAVAEDNAARQIARVLEALDYAPSRVIELGAGEALLRWAVDRTATQRNLTEREREVLELMLRGQRNDDIAETLALKKATVKWHMHNIFNKTQTATREALLRHALQLD